MRNPAYEQALTAQGVEWEYVEKVGLDEINVSKSLANQARLDEPLSEELVEQYGRLEKEGCQSPPLVLWRPGKGMWIVADGNHRVAAKKRAGRKHADAYVLKCSDQRVIDRLTWTFNNAVNGKRLTQEECLQHAIDYVRKYNVSQTDAAKEWGVKHNTLALKVRVAEGREILQKNDVKMTASLTEEALMWLNPLRDAGEDVYCEAARVVGQTGMTRDDVYELARDVKKAKTSEEKLKAIQAAASSPKALERKAETKGGATRVPKNAPREAFARALKTLRNLVEDYDPAAICPSPSDWKAQREMAESVVGRLAKLFALNAAQKEAV